MHQRNRRIHSGNGCFGSFDAPWSERSWINLFNRDSFGLRNPILDFLKEMHSYSPIFPVLYYSRNETFFAEKVDDDIENYK